MDKPTYRLEHFEGPLDLLLHLIEKNKLDIYDIPISEITGQYLDYVNKMEEEDLEIISDFLVMAATLLEIKSKMLLPKEDTDEEEEGDPRAELVARLLEYKKYKCISHELSDLEDGASLFLYHEQDIPAEVAKYIPPLDLSRLFHNVTVERLHALYIDAMRRKEASIDKIRSKFGVIQREKISLQGKIKDVLSYARKHGRFTFRRMLSQKKHTKMEVVVSFLAVLELMKMGKIRLQQDEPFSDMDIESVDDGNNGSEDELQGLEDYD